MDLVRTRRWKKDNPEKYREYMKKYMAKRRKKKKGKRRKIKI